MFVLPPAAAALLLGAIVLQAQQPLRTGTQAVQVDARVMDRDGRFVTTLTKDDLRKRSSRCISYPAER
jgi:hypothetical protein